MPSVAYVDPLVAERAALGLRVRAARVAQSLTQAQVADSACCGRQQIIRIETGCDDVYLSTLLNVVRVLGLRIDTREKADVVEEVLSLDQLRLPRPPRLPGGRFTTSPIPSTTPTPTTPLVTDAMAREIEATPPETSAAPVRTSWPSSIPRPLMRQVLEAWLAWDELERERGRLNNYFAGNGYAARVLREHLQTFLSTDDAPVSADTFVPRQTYDVLMAWLVIGEKFVAQYHTGSQFSAGGVAATNLRIYAFEYRLKHQLRVEDQLVVHEDPVDEDDAVPALSN